MNRHFEKINQESLESRLMILNKEFNDINEYIDIYNEKESTSKKIDNLETTKETLELELKQLKNEKELSTSDSEKDELFELSLEKNEQYLDTLIELNKMLTHVNNLWEKLYGQYDIETLDHRIHEYIRERKDIEKQYLPPTNLGNN